jgi:RNA polymerase sigma factor (sigma-70 family)
MDDFFNAGDLSPTTPLFSGARTEQPAVAASCADPDVALQALHQEYSQKLFNYTLSMLRSREDAEDAVQTTFMNAYGSLSAGRAPRQEASWLFRIARNVCLNRIRTQQRKPASTLEGIDVASNRSVDDVLEQRLHVVALRNALERLPEQQRKAIVMRELQGASYAEIADALTTTQGAVESLIFRARRQLAGALQVSGGDAAFARGAA